MYNYNSGYSGFAMSNRAVAAYSDGEKPISKWTRAEIIEAVTDYAPELAEVLTPLTTAELKRLCLHKTSWHHTSNRFNKTDFYSLNESKLDDLTQERINSIIANREPITKKPKQPKEKPLYITAFVKYSEWEGTRKHPKKVEKREIVQFMNDAKLITCYNSNNYKKRIDSLQIIYKIEQKTKFATKEQLIKKYKIVYNNI